MSEHVSKIPTALVHAQRLLEGNAARGADEFPNPATEVDALVRGITIGDVGTDGQ